MTGESKNVLVGTSLDSSSDPIVRAGAELARRLGAGLHLFHAHPLPVAYFAGPTGMTTISPDLLENERQVRRQLLDEQLSRVGIEAEAIAGTVIEAGAPHRMLLETATSLAADLIVVGSSETPGRAIHGTTTDRVLRKASCPVWVLHGPSRLPPRRILAPVDLSPLSEECLRSGLVLIDELHGEPPEIDALFVLTREELESSTQFTPEQIERMAHEEQRRERKGNQAETLHVIYLVDCVKVLYHTTTPTCNGIRGLHPAVGLLQTFHGAYVVPGAMKNFSGDQVLGHGRL